MNNTKQSIIPLFSCLIIFLSCCNSQRKDWSYTRTIELTDINPIGITIAHDSLWLSDTDRNRLVCITSDGQIIDTIDDFDRPMHIDSDASGLYIPNFGSDQINLYQHGSKTIIDINDSLNAPAGISVRHGEIAIADFYSHSILFFNGVHWASIGSEGHAIGQFYYPTDVQITDEAIIVADAYNHRIQVIDKKGEVQQIIGVDHGINAATGVFVTKSQILVTDFENSRVLIFSKNGKLEQVLTDHLNKPTDILVNNDKVYVTNYKGNSITIYQR